MNLTVTQNINQINVTVTQSNTVIELQPVLNNTGASSGGGAVDSVNGQTGVVVLTADNIPETGTRFWLTNILKTAYDSTVTWIATNGTNLLNHLTNFSNPHNVTASQVGAPLGSGTSTGTNTGDETTLSIQTKRPLKTINSTSLEGIGNINIDISGKLDKVETVDVEKVYIKNADGTQGMKPTSELGGSNEFRIISTADSSNLTGTTAETIMSNFLIPGNTFSAGKSFNVIARVAKSTTVARFDFILYINTSVSLVGANQLMVMANTTASSQFGQATRQFSVKTSETECYSITSTGTAGHTDFIQNTAPPSSVTIDWTVDQRLILVLKNTSASDISRITFFKLTQD